MRNHLTRPAQRLQNARSATDRHQHTDQHVTAAYGSGEPDDPELEPGEVPILDDYEPHDHDTGTPPSLDLDELEDAEREPL